MIDLAGTPSTPQPAGPQGAPGAVERSVAQLKRALIDLYAGTCRELLSRGLSARELDDLLPDERAYLRTLERGTDDVARAYALIKYRLGRTVEQQVDRRASARHELHAQRYAELRRLSLIWEAREEDDESDVYAALRQAWREAPPDLRDAALHDAVDEIVGWGPTQVLLDCAEVEDVMVNGPHQVFVRLRSPESIQEDERGRWLLADRGIAGVARIDLDPGMSRQSPLQLTTRAFEGHEHLRHVVTHMLARINKRVDELTPQVDARWEDGRIHVIIPPLSTHSWCITIRKHPEEPLTWLDLLARGTWDLRLASLLALAVRAKLNILLTGATGAGKTTTLNVLATFVSPAERLVTIEDTAELQLRRRQDGAGQSNAELSGEVELQMAGGLHNVVSLETRLPNVEGRGGYTIRDLVRNTLRMRPDRIIIGEVRGAETLDMIQALNTGHRGTVTTIHANSAGDAFHRLTVMILQAGLEGLTPQHAERLVTSTLHLVVHQALQPTGERRIQEVLAVDPSGREHVTLVRWNHDAHRFDLNARAIAAFLNRPEVRREIDDAATAAEPAPAGIAALYESALTPAEGELTGRLGDAGMLAAIRLMSEVTPGAHDAGDLANLHHLLYEFAHPETRQNQFGHRRPAEVQDTLAALDRVGEQLRHQWWRRLSTGGEDGPALNEGVTPLPGGPKGTPAR
jgi:pilus assembly protein CpaF